MPDTRRALSWLAARGSCLDRMGTKHSRKVWRAASCVFQGPTPVKNRTGPVAASSVVMRLDLHTRKLGRCKPSWRLLGLFVQLTSYGGARPNRQRPRARHRQVSNERPESVSRQGELFRTAGLAAATPHRPVDPLGSFHMPSPEGAHDILLVFHASVHNPPELRPPYTLPCAPRPDIYRCSMRLRRRVALASSHTHTIRGPHILRCLIPS